VNKDVSMNNIRLVYANGAYSPNASQTAPLATQSSRGLRLVDGKQKTLLIHTWT
jgi:hypothetical protein